MNRMAGRVPEGRIERGLGENKWRLETGTRKASHREEEKMRNIFVVKFNVAYENHFFVFAFFIGDFNYFFFCLHLVLFFHSTDR